MGDLEEDDFDSFPDDDLCDCEEYDTDLFEGRAWCPRCGRTWWLTGEEIASEIQLQASIMECIEEAERNSETPAPPVMKVAEQVDELADPFAAWETIDLLTSQNDQLRKAGDAYVASVSGEPEKDCWDTEDGKEAPGAERFASDWSWKAYDEAKWKAFEDLRAALATSEASDV